MLGIHHERDRLSREEGSGGDGQQMNFGGQYIVGARELDRRHVFDLFFHQRLFFRHAARLARKLNRVRYAMGGVE